MAQRKAEGSSSSKDHDIETLRKLVFECVDGEIESSELGNWAYEAWHELSEKKQDGKFLNFLMEISSEWGLLSHTGQEFSKDFLHKILAQAEEYMNIGENEEVEE